MGERAGRLAPPGVLAALLVAGCGGSPPEPQVYTMQGEGLGTTWTVRWLEPPDPVQTEVVEQAVVRVLSEVDQRMSSWRDDSDLARVRGAEGFIEVHPETAWVVEAALQVAAETEGAFDPTVEPLMQAWGFRTTERLEPPDAEALEQARAQVDWRRVRVRYEGSSAFVDAGGTSLDLSAIAKGQAVDRVSHALSALGIPDHMVDIGGDGRAQGRSPRGSAWRFGVEEPDAEMPPGQRLAAVLELTNASVATSGNYRNFRRVDGELVGHILDPRLGRPVRTDVLSATVVAPDCRTADAWATVLLVLEPEDGLARVEARPDLDALLLVQGEDGYVTRSTSGMGAWVADR